MSEIRMCICRTHLYYSTAKDMSTTQFAHTCLWVSVTCISCISLIKNVSLWSVHVLFSQKLLNAIHVMHTRTKHQQLLSVFTGHAMGTIRQFLWCYFLLCSPQDQRPLLQMVVRGKLATTNFAYFWHNCCTCFVIFGYETCSHGSKYELLLIYFDHFRSSCTWQIRSLLMWWPWKNIHQISYCLIQPSRVHSFLRTKFAELVNICENSSLETLKTAHLRVSINVLQNSLFYKTNFFYISWKLSPSSYYLFTCSLNIDMACFDPVLIKTI